MKFLVSLLLLLPLTTPAAVPAQRRRPAAAQPARVEGTSVRLRPPAGFVPATRFPGYVREEDGASIMITELEAPYGEAAVPLADPAQLKKRAMTLLTKESVSVGVNGLLLRVRQSANGTEFLKWILLVGDDTRTVMITATFPEDAGASLSRQLRDSLLSARWDKSARVAPDEGLRFSVSGKGALQSVKRVGYLLTYTSDFDSKSLDEPLFIVAPSFGGPVADDKRVFAENRVFGIEAIKKVGVLKTEPITVDGLSGYETVTDAEDKATGRPMAVYQTILFDEEGYYLMQGLITREHAAEHLPSFREMARSFRRK